jgi:hypothetical protein
MVFQNFSYLKLKYWNSDEQVTGIATESQLLEALRRYTHRPIYVQKCLYNLFRLTPNFGDARVDVIQVCMQKGPAIPRACITAIRNSNSDRKIILCLVIYLHPLETVFIQHNAEPETAFKKDILNFGVSKQLMLFIQITVWE